MHRPRTELATHVVENQPRPPGDLDLMADPALADAAAAAFERLAAAGGPAGARAAQWAHLSEFGRRAGSAQAREWGMAADQNPPRLKAFNPQGERIDEVEFHPAYHELMALGLEGGVASRAWTHPEGGQIAHAALLFMMTTADAGVVCPMSMTYAVTPVLGIADWTAERWIPAVTSGVYDGRAMPLEAKRGATMGMAMTEKQGGSDLRANTTRAQPISDDEVELTGHKWFCSAPMCDGFLTLAYEDAGLTCYLVPRWRPDGTRNAMEIQRLKDKMGDRSNASSEIEYRGAYARRIGEKGRGIATIIQMAHHTRFDCIMGSAAGMRHAVMRAAHHVSQRRAFQKTLIDQPLMRHVLADLALESEAALALGFRVAASFDAAGASEHEALLSRVLTPVAKYWVCKRQPSVVYEALECLGGVGFVEETGMPKLFRTSPLNAIWEGSGNVIALDVQRALADPRVRAAFEAELAAIEEEAPALAPLTAWLRTNPDADPRLVAERAALTFAGGALAVGPLRDGWAALRLLQPSHSWGANAASIDVDALIDRAVSWTR